MMAYVKLIGCGCIALLALGCGSKGSDEDNDDGTGGTSGTSTGGTSGTGTGGSGTGGGGTGGGGTGGMLPIMTTMGFGAETDVCPVGSDANVAGCWKLIESNSQMATSTPVPPADIMYAHTTADGDPDAGAFEANIPYDQPDQWVSFGINIMPVDMSNRTITAKIKIASGMGDDSLPSVPAGGTKIYAKSGMEYCYANGGYTNIDPMHPVGAWHTITFNVASPSYVADCGTFNPADIREIGVQFDTNSASTTAEPAVVLIDTITF
jgi:hypothetical protein